MPKDYQEVEKIVEEFEDNFCFGFVKGRPIHLDDHVDAKEAIDWLRAALTTYGNARELEGVEKVEKRLPTVEQVMIPSLMAGRFEFERVYFLTGKDEYRKATLDHITKIKTELSAKQ
jgi:hypothetical protein